MAGTSFATYERRGKRHLYERFAAGPYIIAVRDAAALRHFVNPTTLTPLSAGRGQRALIAGYGTGAASYRELWLDPLLANNREAHLEFFAAIDVDLPPAVARSRGSDHAFPKCAGEDEVGLTLMNFIDNRLNSSFGGGWEKRLKHRVMAEGLPAFGTLVDLAKALGHWLGDSCDYVGSIRRIPDLLVRAGDAPESDREALDAAAARAIEEWKQQDIGYAVRKGQY